MANIDLNKKVKEKIKSFKEENGCKTYSEAIHILLLKNKFLEKIMEVKK